MQNSSPFSDFYGHDLSVSDVSDIFVENSQLTSELSGKHNSFIWGVRGSGKSMLLKYFDVEVQSKISGGFNSYIQKTDAFIGIYLNLGSGVFNIKNLDLDTHSDSIMLYPSLAYVITEHLIISSICEKLFDKLDKVANFQANKDADAILQTKVNRLLNINQSGDLSVPTADVLKRLLIAIKSEKDKARDALAYYVIGEEIPFDNISLLNYSKLIDVVGAVDEWLQTYFVGIPCIPVYLLLDDVNNLFLYQQQLLNSWIGQRVFSTICFKVACEPFEYRTFSTISDSNRVLQIHADYKEIFLDFDVLFEKDNRRKLYIDIADRRLKRFAQDNNFTPPLHIESIFPKDPEQAHRICILREELAEKYGETRERSRQVWPEYHRRYVRKYAGIDDIIALSFGNIRDYLILCDSLYHRFLEKKQGKLSPQIQHNVIKRFSNDFLSRQSLLGVSDDSVDNSLYTFLVNILALMKYRLIQSSYKEKTFDAFVIKDLSSLEFCGKEVLQQGIRRRYFRKSFYSRRTTTLRQDVFILNKRLFPEYYLNINEAGSRFEFTCNQFLKALSDEGYLLNEFKKKEDIQKKKKAPLGQISLFSIINEDANNEFEEQYEYDFGRL